MSRGIIKVTRIIAELVYSEAICPEHISNIQRCGVDKIQYIC